MKIHVRNVQLNLFGCERFKVLLTQHLLLGGAGRLMTLHVASS